MMRLDKYLAQTGSGTRSEVKKMIRQGNVTIDGETAKKPEQKIDENTQKICVNGKETRYIRYEYYMLHKPAGVISATTDPKEKTVIDLITSSHKKDLFPVGRLDKDTEGLLLITNDGDMAHRLLSPKKHVDKTYYARVEGRVTDKEAALFKEGLYIGNNEYARPSVLHILKEDEISQIELTIQEGKFHQVKRMFQSVGMEVIYLKRLSMGNLKLDPDLPAGEYRELTTEEVESLC